MIKQTQIFVAVMGAGSYTYAEATLSQSLPDWLGSHVRAFIFLGGLPTGITAVYYGLPALMQDLDLAHHDGHYKRVMRSLAKGELHILDRVLHNAYKIELKGE